MWSEGKTLENRDIRDLFGHFATGVAIVTAARENRLVGVTISSFTSISLTPRLIMFSLAKTLLSLPDFEAAPGYGINFLAADQQDLSKRFATKGEDKWLGTSISYSATGAPLLDGALAHIECTPHQRVEAGDHVIFICQVMRFNTPGATKHPLLFFRGKYCLVESPSSPISTLSA